MSAAPSGTDQDAELVQALVQAQDFCARLEQAYWRIQLLSGWARCC